MHPFCPFLIGLLLLAHGKTPYSNILWAFHFMFSLSVFTQFCITLKSIAAKWALELLAREKIKPHTVT